MSALVQFSPATLERFQQIVAKYEIPASALLPTLYLAQEEFGFLSPPVLIYVAGLLKMPPAHVFEAASFYFLFKKKDMGKWCVQICNNITCTMMGSEELIAAAHDELGIAPNELSSDGKFSLLCVQCLGACDKGPVAQVNDDYFENLSPKSFRDLLNRLGRGESVTP